MTVLDNKTFWTQAFDADEAMGLTIRIGSWRCAPLYHRDATPDPVRVLGPASTHWAALRDDDENPDQGLTLRLQYFPFRQDAVDWMVTQLHLEMTAEAGEVE